MDYDNLISGLARLRLGLESYTGDYREAAEEAARLLLLIEDSIAGMTRCWMPACREFLGRTAREAGRLLDAPPDPPTVLSAVVRPARLAALGYLAAQAAGRIYGASLALAAALAAAAFVVAVLEAGGLAVVAAAAAGLGLAVAGALLYSFKASMALTLPALAIEAVAVPESLPAPLVGVGLVLAGYAVASRLVRGALARAEVAMA